MPRRTYLSFGFNRANHARALVVRGLARACQGAHFNHTSNIDPLARNDEIMQRVISRSELHSDESPGSDSGSNQDNNEALETLDELEFTQTGPDPSVSIERHVSEEELDFHLFAPSKPSAGREEGREPQKIRLRSPSVDNSNPGFIRENRDASYYFTNGLSELEEEALRVSALTGEQVIELAKSYRPGSAYSWKVLHIAGSKHARLGHSGAVQMFRKLADEEESQRRKRPGKKARLKVRVKQDVLRKQQLAAKAASEAKDAAEKEKRTKRNREKKVKKKLREKAKKAELAENATTPTSTPND